MKLRQHRPKRGFEQASHLLRREAVDVHEHERDAVAVRQTLEHRPHVFRPELLEEVEMERVRVRKGILVRDLSIEREVCDGIEADLREGTSPGAAAIAADIDDDAREPGWPGRRVLKLVERTIGLEQRVLDRI